jgi:hypothetical protein
VINKEICRAGGVAQTIQHLPSKLKFLSTTQKFKKFKKERKFAKNVTKSLIGF